MANYSDNAYDAQPTNTKGGTTPGQGKAQKASSNPADNNEWYGMVEKDSTHPTQQSSVMPLNLSEQGVGGQHTLNSAPGQSTRDVRPISATEIFQNYNSGNVAEPGDPTMAPNRTAPKAPANKNPRYR